MKKYILTDKESNTTDHHQIREGKHANADDNEIDESVAIIMETGSYSPILAIMEYQDVINDETKMFELHVWSMSGDANDSEGYVVVRKMPLPSVNSDQKLTFAIKAVDAICDFPVYAKWAQGWLNNSDRSVESIRENYRNVIRESQELDEMQELAYTYGEAVNSEEVAEKKALFDRAKLVFSAAELSLAGQANQGFNDNIIQVFDGLEEYVEPEQLSEMANEVLKVA